MKTNGLVKKLTILVALLLVVVMVFSACGKNENPDTDVDNESVVGGDTADNSEDGGEQTGNEDASNKTSTNKGSSNKASTNKGSSNKKNSSSGKTQQSSGSTKWSSTNVEEILKTIPDSVKKKEIHVLMWRDYDESEQQQVNDFMKKTGIKVRTTVTTEKEYNTKLIALISAKDSPDVVYLTPGHFPSRATRGMELLDEKTFRLDDPFWAKDYMDSFRVKNKYYTVAASGIWSSDDCINTVVYNKQLLKAAGVSTMPYDLYKAGQWNWDTYKGMLEKVAAAGKIGATNSMFGLHMLSAGAGFAKYNPDTAEITNLLNDAKVRPVIENAFNKVQEFSNDAKLNYSFMRIDGFQKGDYGFMTTIAYTFYKDGGHLDAMTGGVANVEAVPYPGPTQSTAYIPFGPKTWGVGKGADNAEGAAYFLRYWLDNTTIDFDSTFYNTQFKEVFNILTAKNAKRITAMGAGAIDYSNAAGTYNKIIAELGAAAKGQTPTILDKHKGKIDASIKKANSALKKVADKIK